jgi:hypothetical protein
VPCVLVVAAMDFMTSMTGGRGRAGVTNVFSYMMVVPAGVVTSTVRRVKLRMLGVPRFRWGSSMSFMVLMVSHLVLSCPRKCLLAYSG